MKNGIFEIHKWLKAEDILAAILRAQSFMQKALNQMPFWVTDPESPLYDKTEHYKIPFINKSPREVFDVINRIDAAITKAVANKIHMVIAQYPFRRRISGITNRVVNTCAKCLLAEGIAKRTWHVIGNDR